MYVHASPRSAARRGSRWVQPATKARTIHGAESRLMSDDQPTAQTWPEPVRLPRYWSPAPNAADRTSARAPAIALMLPTAQRRFRAVRRWIPGLLQRNENFRRYFIGQSVSLLGD